MCGIVGYVGPRPAQELLLEGLAEARVPRLRLGRHLGHRAATRIESVRAVGNLANLRARWPRRRELGDGAAPRSPPRHRDTGIGHTRWATHGRVTEAQRPPALRHRRPRARRRERHRRELPRAARRACIDQGAVFTSETDAEVIAHLVAHHMAHGDLVEAVRAAYAELEGHYAFVAMRLDDPDVAGRRPQGVPAGRRPRRRREVHRLRDPRLPRARPPVQIDRERRDRRRHARGRALP